MARTEIQKRETAVPETVAEPRRPTVAPPVDIYENDDELLLLADLPGVSNESLHVRIENGELTVEGHWAGKAEGTLIGAGFPAVDYRRSFTVPDGIAADKVSAELKRGVLHIHLPKAEAYRPRQIKVKAE